MLKNGAVLDDRSPCIYRRIEIALVIMSFCKYNYYEDVFNGLETYL